MTEEERDRILKKAESCCSVKRHYRGGLEKLKVCKSCPLFDLASKGLIERCSEERMSR